MKDWIKQFFLIKTTERRAILVLSVLIMIALFIFLLIPSFVSPPSSKIEVKELSSSGQEILANYTDSTATTNAPKNTAQSFNPNTVTTEELLQAGVPPKLASTWTNFTSKGGKFYKVEDLKKLYNMTDEVYEKIKNKIAIPTPARDYSGYTNTSNTSTVKKNLSININTADTILLDRLPQIGFGRARMIVKYRDMLGGFINIEQLKEVFSINDTIYREIKNYVFVDPTFKPTTVPINFRLEKDLYKHPYIRPYAKMIANYKKEHGPFENKEDLKKIYGIDEKGLTKMLPYINFDLE
jgi:DNA uptake protein ComE-like DNA-binding protein